MYYAFWMFFTISKMKTKKQQLRKVCRNAVQTSAIRTKNCAELVEWKCNIFLDSGEFKRTNNYIGIWYLRIVAERVGFRLAHDKKESTKWIFKLFYAAYCITNVCTHNFNNSALEIDIRSISEKPSQNWNLVNSCTSCPNNVRSMVTIKLGIIKFITPSSKSFDKENWIWRNDLDLEKPKCRHNSDAQVSNNIICKWEMFDGFTTFMELDVCHVVFGMLHASASIYAAAAFVFRVRSNVTHQLLSSAVANTSIRIHNDMPC